MTVTNFVKQIRSGEIDPIEHINRVIDEIKNINKDYNYFNVISEKEALEQAKQVKKNPAGKLAGVPVSVKDCICVKGVESRAGSAILNGYKPVFDATVIDKIRKEGAAPKLIISESESSSIPSSEVEFVSRATSPSSSSKRPATKINQAA